MGTQTRISAQNQAIPAQSEPQTPRWSAATRIAFRFAFVYLGLYSLVTQFSGGLLLFPGFSFPGFGPLSPFRDFTFWLAEHLFGIYSGLDYTGNSGDTYFFWVQTFWVLIVAIVATVLWTALDSKRGNYVTLHKWFRLFVRFAAAAQMFDYGMAKVIPTQMPFPSLTTLVEPLGNISLQGLLWTSIGASPAYQIFTGIAEVVGGVLLLVPATTLLGALVCLADMIMVFVLNMTYDVGVKLIAFHLILLTLFLLAPDISRLMDFFILDRAAAKSTQPRLFSTDRANRIALIVQIVFGLYLIGMYTDITLGYWYSPGEGGAPKSTLYGIWDVEQLSVDGQVRPPVQNDYDRRWQRVIFDAPDSLVFQRTDDTFAHYGAMINATERTLTLTKGNSQTWSSAFTYQRPDADHLILDGEMDGTKIDVHLQLHGFDEMQLLNSTFRWVRPRDP